VRYTGVWKIMPEKIKMDRKKIKPLHRVIIGVWRFDW